MKTLMPVIMMLGIAHTLHANSCDSYLQDADAVSGVVPRLENGVLRSLSIYSEQPFIAPKRSLINKARRQAELKGKRAFSEWIKEKVASGTLNEELMETAEKTSAEGVTQGTAEEITKYSDVIGSQTDSVLSGIIKLDECVDEADKVIFVRMGWKPALSQMAANVASLERTGKITGTTSEANETEVGESSVRETGGNGVAAAPLSRTPEDQDGIKIVTVIVDGVGSTKGVALRDALRQAVSQVFGERFASETVNIDTLVSVEATGDVNSGQAVEATAFSEKVNTSTKGIIHSYHIVSTEKITSGINVTVNVKLAKYDKGLDSKKKNLVVLAPKYTARNKGKNVDEIITGLQDAIESRLSESEQFNILDRENLTVFKKEMDFLEANGGIEEIARIGNMAGADRVVITSITRYHPSVTSRVVGDRKINSSELNATVSLKVVDPASSKVVLSRNVIVNRHKMVGGISTQGNIDILARRVAQKIVRQSGTPVRKSGLGQKRVSHVDRVNKQVDRRFEKLRRKSHDDW